MWNARLRGAGEPAGQGDELLDQRLGDAPPGPAGQLTTYGDLARAIGAPSGARVVGKAVADKTMGILIPAIE